MRGTRTLAKPGQGLLLAAALFVAAVAGSCGGRKTPPNAGNQPADRFLADLGKKALDDKDWEEARGYYKQLIDTYPRSPLVGEARLGIADSYFNQKGSGNLVLAIAEYRDFLTFFPNHPRADYAQFQIGFSYFKQMNKPDRDQTPTSDAVTELKKLPELYRNSLYAQEAQKLLQECYERLAASEYEAGYYYLRHRKACRGAISRFKGILDSYPTYSRIDQVYFRLGEAHELCNSPNEAMPYYKQLIDNFPESNLKVKAEMQLEALGAAANGKQKGPPLSR